MKFTEINQNRMTCSECGGPAFSTLILAEKHDACYNKVRSRYKVWPSAYASGALVQCRKKGAANWGNKTKNEGVNEMDKSQTPPGRSGATPDSGKEYTAKPIKAKDFAKGAADQWIKNLSKDQLDAIAGPRYKKKGVAEGSLNEFAPGSGSGDDSEDPYKYPKPKQYRRSADYFGQFEAGHFDREDFDDAAGVFKGYWGPTQIAYFKFDNPARTGSDDPGMGWYYEPESSASNDTVSAKPAAFDNAEQRKQQELGMIDAFLKSGLTPKPGGQIYNLMKRHGMAESNDDVWGPQGNFAGDKPVNIGGDTVNKLQVGDIVTYFGQKAKIEAMSKTGNTSRITIANKMGGFTKDVLTRDLKRTDVVGKKPVDEDYNPEYDDEAGMADNNLETMRRAVEGIDDLIDSGDNLPEWCQEKIAVAKSMLVSVWDYMRSEQDRGATAELTEEFDLIESIVDRIAAHNGVDAEVVWEDLESLTEDELYAFAVTSQLNEDWSKVNKQDRTSGMSRRAVKAYRRENPGSKLQTAVTTKPSKLKKGSKASKRRKSYCSRSRGQMKMHNISCAKTPDKAICKARRRWNC